jgi:hypothetical protein
MHLPSKSPMFDIYIRQCHAHALYADSRWPSLSAVGICTAVLFLFVALTYSQIVLPRYTTNYSEKDVQQVVNLIITVIATLIGVLCSHCRRYANLLPPTLARFEC